MLVRRFRCVWIIHVCHLGIHDMTGHCSFESGRFHSGSLDRTTKSVKQARNTDERGWTEQLDVVDQLSNVTVEEADRRASPQASTLCDTLENVGQGKI